MNHKGNYVYSTITLLATLWTIDLTWNEFMVGYQACTVFKTSTQNNLQNMYFSTIIVSRYHHHQVQWILRMTLLLLFWETKHSCNDTWCGGIWRVFITLPPALLIALNSQKCTERLQWVRWWWWLHVPEIVHIAGKIVKNTWKKKGQGRANSNCHHWPINPLLLLVSYFLNHHHSK